LPIPPPLKYVLLILWLDRLLGWYFFPPGVPSRPSSIPQAFPIGDKQIWPFLLRLGFAIFSLTRCFGDDTFVSPFIPPYGGAPRYRPFFVLCPFSPQEGHERLPSKTGGSLPHSKSANIVLLLFREPFFYFFLFPLGSPFFSLRGFFSHFVTLFSFLRSFMEIDTSLPSNHRDFAPRYSHPLSRVGQLFFFFLTPFTFRVSSPLRLRLLFVSGRVRGFSFFHVPTREGDRPPPRALFGRRAFPPFCSFLFAKRYPFKCWVERYPFSLQEEMLFLFFFGFFLPWGGGVVFFFCVLGGVFLGFFWFLLGGGPRPSWSALPFLLFLCGTLLHQSHASPLGHKLSLAVPLLQNPLFGSSPPICNFSRPQYSSSIPPPPPWLIFRWCFYTSGLFASLLGRRDFKDNPPPFPF